MKYLKFILAGLLIFCLGGCSVFKNITDSVAGRYMGRLERETKNVKSQVFDCGIGDCFDKIIDILETMQAKILKLDIYNYSILALVSRFGMEEESGETIFDTNNADVGIFLSEASPGKTKVKISCLSSVFLDYSSQKIFSELQPKK